MIIATCFLCAAAFVYVLQNYGLIEACVAGAGVFCDLRADHRNLLHRAQEQREGTHETNREIRDAYRLRRSMVVAAGLQVIRTIGIKRLVPILAVGGLALGFLASRNAQGDQADAPAEVSGLRAEPFFSLPREAAGIKGGGGAANTAVSECADRPPTPNPSPSRASRAEGGEKKTNSIFKQPVTPSLRAQRSNPWRNTC
ncbi:MAG: hypothetical protein WDN50_23585 [Bradyrhizobium sp.]